MGMLQYLLFALKYVLPGLLVAGMVAYFLLKLTIYRKDR
jgi:hypothetical protein